MWAVLQAFGGPAEHWNRLPSWQEERLMSYLSIIHGARGIQYFLEGLPASRALWAECRKVSLEINALAPAVRLSLLLLALSIFSPTFWTPDFVS